MRKFFLEITSTLIIINNNLNHQFEVSSGTVEPGHLMMPIRDYCNFGEPDQVHYIHARCNKIDDLKKNVHCTDGDSNIELVVPYDHLIVAFGNQPQCDEVVGAKEHSIFLQDVGDAVLIRFVFFFCLLKFSFANRNRIAKSMETASGPLASKEEVAQLKSFVIVGNGYNAWRAATELAAQIPQAVALGPYRKTATVHLITSEETGNDFRLPFEVDLVEGMRAAAMALPNLQIHSGTVTAVREKSVQIFTTKGDPWKCVGRDGGV